MHDFLLASMLVTINIIQAFGPNSTTRKEVKEMDENMLEALEKSHSIYTQSKSVTADARISTDAIKASSLLRAVLNKVYRVLGRPLIPEDEDAWRTNETSKVSNISELSLRGELDPSSPLPVLQYHIPFEPNIHFPRFTTARRSLQKRSPNSRDMVYRIS